MEHEIFTVTNEGHERLIIAINDQEQENASHEIIANRFLAALEEACIDNTLIGSGEFMFYCYEFPEVTDDLLDIAIDVLRVKDGHFVVKKHGSPLFRTASSKTIRLQDQYEASNDADAFNVEAIFHDYGFSNQAAS